MAPSKDPACPLCGEPVLAAARRCDNCGAEIVPDELPALQSFLDSLEEDLEPRAAPSASSGGRSEKRADEASRAAHGSTLYLCPSCGSFVSSSEARCPKCGADLAAETGGTEGRTPVAETRLCARCGSTIPVTAEVCPSCGRPVESGTEEIPGLCPNCGSVTPSGRRTCAVCGVSLRPEPAEKRAPAQPTAPSLPSTVVPRPPKGSPRPAGPAVAPLAPAPPKPASAPVRTPAHLKSPAPSPPAPEPEPVAESVPPPRPSSGGRAAARGTLSPPPASRFASLREVSSIATVLALPAVGAAAFLEVPGTDWGRLFAFGLLFGIALGLTVLDLREPLRARLNLGLFLGGLVLLVAVPILGYERAASPALDAGLIGVGVAMLVLVTWRLRRSVGPFLTWNVGLLLLTALAVSPFLLAAPGPPGIDDALWALGAALAFGSAAFIVLRRWLRAAADQRLARGDAAYARRDYDQAIGAYESAIRMGRRMAFDVPAGWYGKGAALVAAERFQEGLRALDQALALHPENEIAWINKGTALTRLGRMNDALKCYNSAIKVNPRYEVAWNNKANALARLGKPELALACYEKALQIDPAYRTAWVNKGFVLTKLGRFEEAAECADAAVRLTAGAAASA